MWSQCLANSVTKLDRNSLGTEPWHWCVTVPCSNEQSDPPIAFEDSHKAQAGFALSIQACSCLCLEWVFHAVRLVPVPVVPVHPQQSKSLHSLHYCVVISHFSGRLCHWTWRASTPCLLAELGFLPLLCLASPHEADLWLINPTAELRCVRSLFLSVFRIRETFLILS